MTKQDKTGAESPSRYTFYHDGQVMTLPDPEWIIDGILPANAVAELYGDYAVGKSFVAFDWALSVATGLPWAGLQVRQGPVVYVYAEGRSGIKQRVAAWKSRRGMPATEIAGKGVFFLPLDVQLCDPKDVTAFLNAIEQQVPDSPALIVIDTLARCMVGKDESSAKDMSRVIWAADLLRERFGATALIIHHTGWDGAHGRGSSALPAALDTMMVLKKKSGGIELLCEKQKDAAEFNTIKLTLVPTLGSCTIHAEEGSSAAFGASHMSPGALRCLGVLSEFDPKGATSSEWCDASQRATGAGRSTFHRQLAELKRRGCVEGGGRNTEYCLSGNGRLLLSSKKGDVTDE